MSVTQVVKSKPTGKLFVGGELLIDLLEEWQRARSASPPASSPPPAYTKRWILTRIPGNTSCVRELARYTVATFDGHFGVRDRQTLLKFSFSVDH